MKIVREVLISADALRQSEEVAPGTPSRTDLHITSESPTGRLSLSLALHDVSAAWGKSLESDENEPSVLEQNAGGLPYTNRYLSGGASRPKEVVEPVMNPALRPGSRPKHHHF